MHYNFVIDVYCLQIIFKYIINLVIVPHVLRVTYYIELSKK